MGYIDQLENRVSPKIFDGKSVGLENLYLLMKACNLSPTSFGIQPVRASVVTSETCKSSLLKSTYNQPQVMSCSNLIVLSVLDVRKDNYIENYGNLIKITQGLNEESIEYYKSSINKFLYCMNETDYIKWSSNQAYLTLGILVSACTSLGIDCCPIEGFNKNEYGEILNLTESGYSPVIICAIGYASPEDPKSMLPKVRISNSEYVLDEF